MFIINLKYVVPIEKVEKVRDEHVAFLEKFYEKSIFLASGPKIPRLGGIILASGVNKEEIDQIIQEDPFWKKQIAEYEIIEFTPTINANSLNGLLN